MTAGTAPDTAPQEALSSIAQGNAPVFEQIVAMNLDTLENSKFDPRTYLLVRLAALVAMDAAPASYLIHLGVAEEAGVTLEDAQGVLLAIAPMVGSARVVSATGKILRAFGLAAALDEGTI